MFTILNYKFKLHFLISLKKLKRLLNEFEKVLSTYQFYVTIIIY